MELTINIKAIELKALRRAVFSLYADEKARHPFRERKSQIEAACETLMDKIEEATKKVAK
jgi:hypothetical protein